MGVKGAALPKSGKIAAPAVADLERPMPGAWMALVLLLAINMFNYIDRQVLAAVETPIEKEFFPQAQGETGEDSGAPKTYAKFFMGLLVPAFLVSYSLIVPLFGWLADRTSRWLLIGIGILLWSLASGASGLATTFWV